MCCIVRAVGQEERSTQGGDEQETWAEKIARIKEERAALREALENALDETNAVYERRIGDVL